MSALPLLPTTSIGSLGKPSWWFAAWELHASGRFGPVDLQEMLDDAVDIVLLDQQRAGIDIVTDGEHRRKDGYVDGYYELLGGLQALPSNRFVGPWGYDQQTRYRAIGPIQLPAGGLGLAEDFRSLRARTDKPIKVTLPGPMTLGSRIDPGEIYRDRTAVWEFFADVVNAELRACVAAGADFVQLDEPCRTGVTGQEMARLYNRAVEGVEAHRAFHICFGNRFGRGRFQRTYAHLFPSVLEANCHQFVLEFASREMSEVELAGQLGDRQLGAGIIDVKNFYPETPEDVAQRLETVLRHIRPERVYVNPDCGFGWSPRNMCQPKLESMVAGTRLVRARLSGVRDADADADANASAIVAAT
jgi:5-methyltetrahydropteroyltriglutamate--homocysteine methyltransferase